MNQAVKGDKKVQERTTLVGFGIGNGIGPIGRLETSKWGLFVCFGNFFLSEKRVQKFGTPPRVLGVPVSQPQTTTL